MTYPQKPDDANGLPLHTGQLFPYHPKSSFHQMLQEGMEAITLK